MFFFLDIRIASEISLSLKYGNYCTAIQWKKTHA